MENDTSDLSCDPANPRRYEVPGPHGVKCTTEDYVDVSNQASTSVNVTGKKPSHSETSRKAYTQQVFHRSFFVNRPRSSSLSALPTAEGTNDSQPQLEETDSQKDSSMLSQEQPPSWQRIPTTKKRKICDEPPSPEGTSCKNSFSGLPIDHVDDAPPKPKALSKPPPIILYETENLNELTKLLHFVT